MVGQTFQKFCDINFRQNISVPSDVISPSDREKYKMLAKDAVGILDRLLVGHLRSVAGFIKVWRMRNDPSLSPSALVEVLAAGSSINNLIFTPGSIEADCASWQLHHYVESELSGNQVDAPLLESEVSDSSPEIMEADDMTPIAFKHDDFPPSLLDQCDEPEWSFNQGDAGFVEERVAAGDATSPFICKNEDCAPHLLDDYDESDWPVNESDMRFQEDAVPGSSIGIVCNREDCPSFLLDQCDEPEWSFNQGDAGLVEDRVMAGDATSRMVCKNEDRAPHLLDDYGKLDCQVNQGSAQSLEGAVSAPSQEAITAAAATPQPAPAAPAATAKRARPENPLCEHRNRAGTARLQRGRCGEGPALRGEPAKSRGAGP